MKLLLKTAALLGVALALAGTASAQTTIRVVGATTFRAPVTQAIMDSLKPGFVWAYDQSASAPYKAGAAIFSGNLKSTNAAVIYKTFWTGSLAGVADLVNGTNVTGFIPSTVTMTTGGTNVHGLFTAEAGKPDAALSDAQGSTIGAVLGTTASAGGTVTNLGKTGLVDSGSTGGAFAGDLGTVGIAPMAWYLGCVAQAAYNPGITNMTQQNASYVQSNPVPISFMTGNGAADQNSYAFLVGRNEDSGTRIVCLSEAQVLYGTSVTQYAPSFSNNQNTDGTWVGTGFNNPNSGAIQTGGLDSAKTQFSTVTGFQAWNQNAALNTEPTINWNIVGHSGYIGGGDVANVLLSTNPCLVSTPLTLPTSLSTPPGMTKAYFVGYMGIADGGLTYATNFNAGSKPPVGTAANPLLLSYNGVPYSVAAVQSGQYSLWTFEHMYRVGSTTVSGVTVPSGATLQGINDVADAVFNGDVTINSSGVLNQPNAAGIQFTSSCLATRTQEGGALSEDYY
jgi:hypothetical protein